VEIDAITEGEWDREWVIPYGDPEEPDKGEAKMRIRVKNVRENTPVRIFVSHINEIDDALNDHPYTDAGWGEDEQPGLQQLTVRDGRVVRPDGTEPVVRFNNYAEHWNYPGVNFYQFAVGFGEHGDAMVASKRDYVNHESDCLHMRFTVFIHCSSMRDRYRNCAQELWRFLKRETEYFRPYKMMGNPRSRDQWLSYYRNRYIVAVQGHAICECGHGEHPTREIGRGRQRRRVPMDLYHSGFTPDRYVCPPNIEDTDVARTQVDWDRRHYRRPFGGCSHSSHVIHALNLGRDQSARRQVALAHQLNRPTTERPLLVLDKRRDTDPPELRGLGSSDLDPKLLFYAGGCRSLLTKNLGERFTRNGTKYYHGWVYSVWITENQRFCLDFFRRWIKGTDEDPATSECDPNRFVSAYRAINGRSYVSCHPRLLEGQNILNPRPAPDTAARAVE